MNIFFPLVDLTNANGPTAFAPGTHSDGACRDALATIIETGDPAQQISPLLSTGDAVMFDCRLLHRGRANRSSKDRVIAYLTVAAPWWRDDEMFHSTQPTTAAALLGEALLGRTAARPDDEWNVRLWLASVRYAYGNESLVCPMWQVFRRRAVKAGYQPFGGAKCDR